MSVNVTLTLPEEVYEIVKKRAESLGLGFSPYIRMLIIKTLKKGENHVKDG
jgi:predicted DNA binding CopG/RHH family protein